MKESGEGREWRGGEWRLDEEEGEGESRSSNRRRNIIL